MSAEAGHDKPHAPTPRRREEARRKGQVPRSTDLNAAVILLGAALLIGVGTPGLARGILEVQGETLARSVAPPEGVDATAEWLASLGWKVLGALSGPVFLITAVALLVGGAQGRGVLSTDPIRPKWEKLDPVRNAQRLWGWKAVMELAKSLLKMGIMGGVVFLAFALSWERIPVLSQLPPLALLELIRRSAMQMLLPAGGAFLIVAALDYAFQVWQHERNLRMTDDEIRREQRESDGDPHMRTRRMAMGRSLARRRMMLAVSEADVVLTNPTHVAVALKWDPSLAPAPIVLAMGVRKVALRIREKAAEADVPIIENPPLARALVAAGKVGQPIPMEFYVMVAEVLAFVFRERARSPRRWEGSEVA